MVQLSIQWLFLKYNKPKTHVLPSLFFLLRQNFSLLVPARYVEKQTKNLKYDPEYEQQNCSASIDLFGTVLYLCISNKPAGLAVVPAPFSQNASPNLKWSGSSHFPAIHKWSYYMGS